MKKYVLLLIATVTISLETQSVFEGGYISQPKKEQSWYDWGKKGLKRVGNVTGHYLLPQDKYMLPAYLATVFATTGLGAQPIGRGLEDLVNYVTGNKTGVYDEKGLSIGDQWRLLTYLHIPALWALGHAARKVGNFYNPPTHDQTNYAYYAPGVIAGLSPYALMSLSNALNIPYSDLMQKIGFLGMTTGPLLLGAGHLAHQYFNPPIQEPIVPVLPEQIEEEMHLQDVEQIPHIGE